MLAHALKPLEKTELKIKRASLLGNPKKIHLKIRNLSFWFQCFFGNLFRIFGVLVFLKKFVFKCSSNWFLFVRKMAWPKFCLCYIFTNFTNNLTKWIKMKLNYKFPYFQWWLIDLLQRSKDIYTKEIKITFLWYVWTGCFFKENKNRQ